jgi:YegS/Rv2252/BmrU family lipid kinase
VFDRTWPFTAEEQLTRDLSDDRTEQLNDVTYVLSGLGNTAAIVVATAVVALFLRWRLKRWREPIFLALAVALQATVFLLTTLVIDRERPVARAMDDAPATSSFPSGHTGAAAALFLASALIIGWHLRNRWLKIGVITLFVAAPLLVAYSRLYRGMHHPSDIAGSYINALASIAIANTAVRGRWRGRARPEPLRPPRRNNDEDGEVYVERAAFIYNPTKVPDFEGLKNRVEKFMTANGWGLPLWLETTRDDPGISACERAVEDKVDVVFVCGGDGTVMAAVTSLAGRDMPMAILPAGTGNLLARNLGLPLDDEEAALRIGVSGHERVIDVAAIEDRKFAVMAGIGLDAAIMRDARDDLKKAMGWPAYVVSFGKHLRGEGMRVTLTLDDERPFQRRVRTVVVGNVGKLQANIPLMPDAQPDDGLLDVVLLAPRGTLDWARVVGLVVTGRLTRDRRVERFRCKHVVIETISPQPRQLDGDLIEDGTNMDIQIEPLALRVRVQAYR